MYTVKRYRMLWALGTYKYIIKAMYRDYLFLNNNVYVPSKTDNAWLIELLLPFSVSSFQVKTAIYV